MEKKFKAQDLTLGCEIEFTGMTRQQAATVMAKTLGTEYPEHRRSYDSWVCKEQTGREWKIASDSSIEVQCAHGRSPAEQERRLYRCELVTPILRWEDIATLQQVVRDLRAAGAIVNESCGLHVHIGARSFEAKNLVNLVKTWASKENLVYKAFGVMNSRLTYCEKTNQKFLTKIEQQAPATDEALANAWYDTLAPGEDRDTHYNDSRYHGLNLHAYWTKGTVEFRVFNSTLHAGKVKAYLQFCAAVCAAALNASRSSSRSTATGNDKYTFRCWLLRLGMIGDEFKTAREHLLSNLAGDAGWRTDEQRQTGNERDRERRQQQQTMVA